MPVYEYVCRKCNTRYDLSRPMSRSEEDTPCPVCDGTGQRVYSVFTALSKGIGTISPRHSVGRAGTAAAVVPAEPETRAAEAPLEVEALVLRSFQAVQSPATSQRWADALAAELRTAYAGDPSVRVVQRGSADTPELGRVDLPVDVTVWRAGSNAAPGEEGEATYVREVLWQVSVELSDDPRDALHALNRLVLGAATSKLLVGPQHGDATSVLSTLQRAAAACSGQLFFALAPMASAPDAAPRMWRFREGRWNLYPG